MKFKAEEIERWEKRTPYNVEYSKIEEIDGDIASIDIPIKHFDEIIEQLELPLGTLFYFKVKPDFLYNDWWKDEPIIWLGQADGSFVIYIDPARISEVKKLHLLFSMLSAYRWQMQRTNSNIGSVVFNPNYENFIAWVCEKTGESRDTMDHYMFEVSPYHNDSIMFACECLGVERPTLEAFKITPELLKRLDK